MSSFGKRSTAEQVLRNIDLTGKNVLITGANVGIGYESALQMAKHNANVYATSRSKEVANKAIEELKSQSGNSNIFPVILELGDLASIRKAASNLSSVKFDILLFNAGLNQGERHLTKDGFEQTFGVNHLGHFLLGNLLINQLNDNARVVVVSSDVTKIGFLRSEGMLWDDLMFEKTKFVRMQVYAQSKLANIYFAYELNKIFKERGIKASAYSINPGLTYTSLARDANWFILKLMRLVVWLFAKSPEQGAATQVYVATAPEIDPDVDGGKYYSNCNEEPPCVHAQEPQVKEHAKRLWDISMKYVGLKN